MKGRLLFVLAVLTFTVLLPFLTAYNAVRSLFYSSNRLYYLAILIDKAGNVLAGPLFNDILQRQGYEFGHYNETISKVLGINKGLGTLTKTGRLLARFLNWLDKDHVEKAITSL